MKYLMVFAMLFMMSWSSTIQADSIDKKTSFNNPLFINTLSSGKYELYFTSDNAENVKIRIYNDKGHLIHTDNIINYDGFKLPYDFSSLPYGNYGVKLFANDETYSTTINHLKEESSFFKTSLNTEEGKDKFSVQVERALKQPVTITILDINGRVIFTEEIDVDHDFTRNYDFSHPAVNAKSILVYSGGNSIKHSI